MDNENEFAMSALRILMEKAEPKLNAALEAHGVSSPTELPDDVAQKIFSETVVGTTAENFPNANLDALSHGMAAFKHDRFLPAFNRLQKQCAEGFDAFLPASGIDAAIVLAGLGMPVAPFDRKQPRILAEPSKDIDVVIELFSKWKTAFVGYSPCDLPFYMVFTDCLRSMSGQILSRPELAEIRQLSDRENEPVSDVPCSLFRHGIVLFGRERADTVSTLFFNNPSPTNGSVVIYAGWKIGEIREGTPNDGFVPVPMQFVRAVANDPKIGMWMWEPVGVKTYMN